MKQPLFSYIAIAVAPIVFLCCTNDRDGYSHRLIFFSQPFYLLENVVFSTKSTGFFDICAHIGECNLDISEQLIHQVNDLVLCRIFTILAVWLAEIRTVYSIMFSNSLLPLTVFGRESCLKLSYSLE